MTSKATVKRILGELPLTAEAYWYLRQAGKPLNKSFNLEALRTILPGCREAAAQAASRAKSGQQILLFATLHYWISHAALSGLALAGLGHDVTLAFLPYGRWQQILSRFDLRRQNVYAREVLREASPLIETVSFLSLDSQGTKLPSSLEDEVAEVALRDTQYTLQVEQVSRDSDLFRLRLERNLDAARAAMTWLKRETPEVVIVPNGTILEFGVLFRVVRFLGIPSVTYEFGEQRKRIWLAQDAEVMRQSTHEMWTACGGQRLDPGQLEQVQALFAARQKASLWENFARRWQGVPSQGGEQVRQALGLDHRPVVLLATNVIGDSLTLGRQVFSDSMTEWLVRTTQYFAGKPGIQLVVRIHPGELITKGPSVAEVIERALPGGLLEHIHLVAADAAVNTYDIAEIADLGLVYTTTVGLEMAMGGVPVIAIGQTHYRGKGFTLDPDTWQAYFDLLDRILEKPERFRLSREQVDLAWEYAYRFFFEYPHPYPWHLVHLWEDLGEWPMGKVLGEQGQARFSDTFRYLAGEPVNWSKKAALSKQGEQV